MEVKYRAPQQLEALFYGARWRASWAGCLITTKFRDWSPVLYILRLHPSSHLVYKAISTKHEGTLGSGSYEEYLASGYSFFTRAEGSLGLLTFLRQQHVSLHSAFMPPQLSWPDSVGQPPNSQTPNPKPLYGSP